MITSDQVPPIPGRPLKQSNLDKVEAIFQPDDTGNSSWIKKEDIVHGGLKFSGNGNARHGVFFGVRKYIWQARRLNGPKSAVTHLRTGGLTVAEGVSSKIRPDIKSQILSHSFCNLSLVKVPKEASEIDHRYGYKSHVDYIKRYDLENQQLADFQLLHRSQNVIKRQMCIQCVRDGVRPPHPELGYAKGDSTLSPKHPCEGCFLAQPELYRNKKPT